MNDMPDNMPEIERLRALALNMEAARLAMEEAADDYLTELEDRLSDAYDGVEALLRTARAAVDGHGKRFSDWVAKAEAARDALGIINANGVPSEED